MTKNTYKHTALQESWYSSLFSFSIKRSTKIQSQAHGLNMYQMENLQAFTAMLLADTQKASSIGLTVLEPTGP